MKALKVNDEILAFLNEQDPKMQALIEKYRLLPQYEIVNVIPCPLCNGAKWIEKEEK